MHGKMAKLIWIPFIVYEKTDFDPFSCLDAFTTLS